MYVPVFYKYLPQAASLTHDQSLNSSLLSGTSLWHRLLLTPCFTSFVRSKSFGLFIIFMSYSLCLLLALYIGTLKSFHCK